MWVDFYRCSKKAHPCYKLQIPPLQRKPRCSERNVPRLLMSADQTNIAKTFTESLPVPSK